MRNIILAACFVALNVLDAALTQVADIRGTPCEISPVVRAIMLSPSLPGCYWGLIWGVKMGAVVGCTLILLMLGRHYPRQIRKVFIGLVVLMVVVCVVNVIGLL